MSKYCHESSELLEWYECARTVTLPKVPSLNLSKLLTLGITNIEFIRPSTLSPSVVDDDMVAGREYVVSGTVRKPGLINKSARSLLRG